MTQKYSDFIAFLAAESAKIIKPYFFNPALEVEMKANETPVTIADRNAEERLRALISDKYPQHGIIGEEFGSENSDAEFVWVLDPIDGTISFASGCPLFGTLICLLHNGRPLVGAINLPALDQLCIGDGRRTTVNGRPVRMRETRELSAATLLTTDYLNIAQYQDRAAFEALSEKTRVTRTWGDCYGYFLLASGWADIMVDPIMNAWDLLALVPVIEGAGGVISGWQGDDAVSATSCVAANRHLHGAVIDILNLS